MLKDIIDCRLAKHLRGFGGPFFGNHDALALWLKAKLNAKSSAHADHISRERLAMTTMSSNRGVIGDCGYRMLCGDVDASGPYSGLLHGSGIWRRSRR